MLCKNPWLLHMCRSVSKVSPVLHANLIDRYDNDNSASFTEYLDVAPTSRLCHSVSKVSPLLHANLIDRYDNDTLASFTEYSDVAPTSRFFLQARLCHSPNVVVSDGCHSAPWLVGHVVLGGAG
jgi:hypothetical protein